VASKKSYIRALIYGDWGVGKTTLACSSGRTTLHLSSGDNGEDVLHNHPEALHKTSTLLMEGISHVEAVAEAVASSAGYDHYGAYRDGVLVIDTASGLCVRYLGNLVDNYNVKNDRLLAKPRGTGDTLEAEGLADYRFLANHMAKAVPTIHSAPMDVVWLAWEREPSFLDKERSNFLTRPKMPEKAMDAIAEGCHLVGCMEKKGTKRTLNFEGSNRFAGKSRISKFNDKVVPVDSFWSAVDEWRDSRG
jgi:hypothetical protein